MMNQRLTKSDAPVLLTALAVCLLIAGCQQLRLPAIDPSGNRIFLPPPNSTALAGPSASGGLFPRPAFTSPAVPPPCDPSMIPVSPFPQVQSPGMTVIPQEPAPGSAVAPPAQAAGLEVKVSGPASAGIDSALTYRIEISNPGDATVRDIALSDERTSGLEIVSSQPAGTPFGERLEWRIGQLPPRSAMAIDVHCRVTERGAQQYCVSATGGGRQSRSCQQTQVSVPAIGLVMRGPDQLEVGQQAEFEVEITNQGNVPLENVLLVDQYDAGLQHASGAPSPIEKQLDAPIDPGQTAYIKMIYDTVQAGESCHTLTVTATGGHRAEARSCVTITAPQVITRPQIEARITGPQEQTVGDLADYLMEVRNTGNVPLTNVQVHFTFSPSLAPVKATDDHQWHQGGLLWQNRIPRLEPGQSDSIRARCQCLHADPAAEANLVVTSSENVSDSSQVQTRIAAATVTVPAIPDKPEVPAIPDEPGEEPDMGDTAPELPVTGQLTLTVVDLDDSIQKEQTTTYVVTLKNDRNVADANVTLTFHIPDGMELVRFRHELEGKRVFSPDGRSIEVGPIKALRAGESYPAFRVTLKGTLAGTFPFHVQAHSQRTPEGIEEVEDTTVVE